MAFLSLSKFAIAALWLVAVAVFVTLTANFSFWQHFNHAYAWQDNLSFWFSLSLVVTASILLCISLFSVFVGYRLAALSTLVVAQGIAFFTDSFGTVIDTDMLINLVQTDVGEASDLIGWGVILRVVLLGCLPAALLWFWSPRDLGLAGNWKLAVTSFLVATVTLILGVLISLSSYPSFLREHKPVRSYINPVYPVYSLFKLAGEAVNQIDTSYHLVARTITPAVSLVKPRLLVMVVGETVRADHWQLNGYDRATTPLLAARSGVINYGRMRACGTSTAISVPCMFSLFDRKRFNRPESPYAQNVLDILAQAGVTVLWRDNNSSSKGVADRLEYQSFRSEDVNPVCDLECRDVGMLVGLRDYIEQQAGDSLVVLHPMGSHGPAYYRRYTDEFEVFKPTCQTNELAECEREHIVNSYDNTLVYTDYFLNETIELLSSLSERYSVALLYVSDHGESLGEGGLYLHGLPYLTAPQSQTRVAAFAWSPEGGLIDPQLSITRAQLNLSHDNVAPTLLEAFGVKVKLLNDEPLKEPLFVARSSSAVTSSDN